ncbi:HupE/UreJ family protein [Acaryochloris sp. IP29b_bin.148]|uniref:HupE/UreJ family protein n=1 Tax=Acaryochloris sp. IP29b_bin.148 TaxID=2969218 RepID=UPI002632AEB5|nr:HupE/UreJ family protein [Acaryochloris sp. IP29b_bin.148]
MSTAIRPKARGARSSLVVHSLWAITLAGFGLLLFAPNALAHHPLAGRLPANFFEGFMSGVAHPVIGVDHFVFVIAVGLISALMRQGVMIPIAFVIAGLAGTGMHLQRLDLPAPEFFISASVLLFGVLLALKRHPNWQIVAGLAAVAGIFHGYAYGEAIVGADMTPMVAYLSGFTVIQLGVALGARAIGRRMLKGHQMPELPLRFSGFAICGFGAAFLSALILG